MPETKVQAQTSPEFDALSFEIQHYQDFQRNCGNKDCSQVCSKNYYEGVYDAKLNIEPTMEHWVSADYRSGYLKGISERYSDRFKLT